MIKASKEENLMKMDQGYGRKSVQVGGSLKQGPESSRQASTGG